MENLRRDLRHAQEELAQMRHELEERNRQLRELLRALPFPDSEQFCRNIVDLCHEFHLCTTRTTELDDRIKALRRSTDTCQDRLHDIAFTELSVEKLRVKIMSTTTEQNQQDSLEIQDQIRMAVSKVHSSLDSVLSAINQHSRDKPAGSLQEDETMEESPCEDPPVQQEPISQRP
ncbi:hypothetical protein GCK32_001146 [Trichostrongylus colubriformis]|uniref:Uncharacterized protein n=1 Tax=Trichostrongylus colubriformis TaxID=6319 RepID=A0AAN8FQ40_TRICO